MTHDATPSVTAADRQRLFALLARRSSADTQRIAARAAGDDAASHAQEALWFIDRLVGPSGLYNTTRAVRSRGPLDVGALQRSVQALVERHESLRTAFVEHDGRPVQRVVQGCRAALAQRDAAGADDVALQGLMHDEAARPFALDAAPLLRATLWRLGTDDHALQLVIHHIVCDGWSMSVAARDLAELYAAHRDGRPPRLPPLDVQAADHAAWQRRRLAGARRDALLDHWRARLAGIEPLDLPADQPRPARQSHAGDVLRVSLRAALVECLRGVAHSRRATLFMVLLAAFDMLLMRWTGQRDIAVGTPFAGRDRPELEGLIGYLVNTVVLRTDVDRDLPFDELLLRVRETVLDATAHAELPFERLVAALAPQRDLARAPLVQVSFQLHNEPEAEFRFAGTTAEALPVHTGTAKFDLALGIAPAGDGTFVATFEYCRDLFDRATIERFAAHYMRLLDALADRPTLPVDRLPLLADEERRQLLADWSTTRGAEPPDRCVHQLFEACADRWPDAPAVVRDDTVLSYRQLDARANRLARRLRRLGLRPDDRVAVIAERDADTVVAQLATLKAGAAYLPLDPAHPPDRLAWMLADAAPRVLLAHGGAPLPAHDGAVAQAIDDATLCGESEERLPPDDIGRAVDALAYVIYTSGSTGRPKGVLGHHRGVVNLLSSNIVDFALGPGSRFLQFASPSFDASVWETWLALCSGACLQFAPREALLPGAPLTHTLRSLGSTHLFLPPSALAALGDDPQALAGVQTLVVGGEAFPAALAARWAARLHRVFNAYGPTEASICTTLHRCDASGDGLLPIGRPVPHSRVYIVDPAGEPVPIGVVGEIHIGGPGLARGYLHRPELDAERFVPDPFAGSPAARRYRTGDLGRWRADGSIEYLGRNDLQLKIRGFRIEPGEIESRIAAHDGVRAAVVVAREESPGDKRLVAYVAADRLDVAALRRHLRTVLPEYMVPAACVRLDALPMTSSGKVDRRALPPPPADVARDDDATAASTLEQSIIDVWRAVLGVARIGLHDSFFDLGGHSLLATQVVARLHAVLGVDIPLRALFDTPTVAALARHAETAAAAEDEPPLAARTHRQPLPLTSVQLGMWWAERLDGDAASAYHMQWAERLRGALDRATVDAALRGLVERHQALRVRFFDAGEQPLQALDDTAELHPRHVDLSSLAGAAQQQALDRALGDAVRERFDLAKPPLLRATVVRLGEADHVLHVVVHHLVADGWSLQVLRRDWVHLLASRRAARPAPPPPTIGWLDVATREHERIAGPRFAALTQWWIRRLRGLAPLTLPFEGAPGTDGVLQPSRLTVGLDASTASRLHALAAGADASPFMVYLAALQLLLMRWCGQDDIAVGTPIARRDRAGLDAVVGPLLNTLVLRTDLSGAPRFAELLARVRAVALDAYARQEQPFDALVGALNPPRVPGRHPLFDVMINAVGDWRPPAPPDGLASEPLELASGPAKFALTLYVDSHATAPQLSFAWRADRFTAAQMRHFADQYLQLLAQVAAQPDAAIDGLSLLTPESQALLADPARPLPRAPQADVWSLFEAQARRAPDAPALRWGARRWCYGELHRAVLALAGRLQRAGLRPGDVVGIEGARSPAVAVAMSAVAACGGVFLTLDPALPAARRALMLRDASAALLCRIDPAAEEDEPPPCAVLPLHADLSGLDADAAASLTPMSDDAPAYVFFTSGTTGRPKGVVGSRHGLSHFLRWQRETFSIGPGDRVSQLIGLGFDPLLRDVFLPLTSGATLCIPTQADLLDPLGWCAREGITALHTTPTLLGAWMQWCDAATVGTDALRWLFVSGEPLTGGLVRAWRERCTGTARVVNLYGPTETTMVRCFDIVDEPASPGLQPVGRALPDSQLLVVTPGGGLAGIGELGEIVVRTPYRSLGYLGLPDETKRRFRPNPWRGDDAADLLYHTGDLGRWRGDGRLDVAGRIDDQVKIRGVRAEPAEVQAELAAIDGVRQCVVLAQREPRSGETVLAAWLVADRHAALSATDLRRRLAARLPAALVPAAFCFVDALPRLPNGKVDRKALPEPDFAPAAHAEPTPPRTPLERTLWAIWRDVLRLDTFGADDNFFDLGGHSLLVTQVVSRLRAQAGLELPLRALFEHPTVRSLAREAERVQAGAAAARPAPMPKVRRDGALPVSYSQRRMWLVQTLNPQTRAYNMTLPLRLRGALDAAAFERALDWVVQRHESFRTRFGVVDGEPVQFIDPPRPLELSRADLRGLPADAREREARRLRETLVLEAFDLSRSGLYRALLVRMADDEHLLLWIIHHAIGDAWSHGILWRELGHAYDRYACGGAPTLAPLQVEYADYAAWQRDPARQALLEPQMAYWRERLDGVPPLALPVDRAWRDLPSGRGGRVSAALSPATLDALRRFSARHGATPFMTLLACLKLLLARHAGQSDIAVGSPIANRTQLESEHLVGTLVNTLVMRTDLGGEPSFAELLARVRETALQAYAHQDASFERLVEELRIDRHAARSPLVQVLFNVINAPFDVAAMNGLKLVPFEFEAVSAQFDLTMTVDTDVFGEIRLSYSTDVYVRATAERLLAAYLQLLDQVLADASRPIGDYELVAPAARAALDRWNDTRMAWQVPATVDRLLGQALARHAPRAAIVFGGGEIDHATLARDVNRLARALRARGVARGCLVGLSVERSPAMIVAQLAILRAGAAYVPLDPAYPAERIAFMADDAGLALRVTEAPLAAAFGWPRESCLLLDDDAQAIAAESDEAPAPDDALDARPDDAAYVIYTSGSTGRPKGVIVPHRAVVNFLASMAREPGLAADDRLVAVTTLSFDIAVLELLLPLSVGARVVLATREQATDGPALRQLIEAHVATAMQATPSTWRLLLEAGWRGGERFKALIGGEPLPADLAAQLLRCTGELWNMYGPTETTVWSTCWRVERPEDGISIGRPIANTTVRVRDEHGRACPIGVPGEICIGGDGVALGYLRRPELTAERFVPDPHAAAPQARLYRTGDRGRWRHDGLLEHLGRLDFQVKVRGHRIELGEIESMLITHPAVGQALVMAREDAPGDVRLVAYLVSPQTLPPPAELRSHLRRQLPDQMVPQHYVQLDAMPLLPNGKVDRRSLPLPAEAPAPGRHDAALAPSSADEIAVAAVWSRLLGVDDVRVTDNFFDLGGHSLLAMRAIADIEKACGLRIHPRRFVGETLEQLARREAALRKPAAAPESPDGDGWWQRLRRRFGKH